MSSTVTGIRWKHVVSAALSVIAMAFLVLVIIIAGYAFALAFQVRGTPDQIAINHFAARISPRLMPWLVAVFAFMAACFVARKPGVSGVTHGLLIGILAGLLSVAVRLAFGARLGLHSAIFLLIVAALGWLGGVAGHRSRA
ncbi:MAG TPA: hypothetical protein VGM51_07590 [Armatimonadota bacterium]|jgi:hypothetical protein